MYWNHAFKKYFRGWENAQEKNLSETENYDYSLIPIL